MYLQIAQKEGRNKNTTTLPHYRKNGRKNTEEDYCKFVAYN